EVAGGAKYYWNGGDHPSIDDNESLVGRIEGGQEYYYGSDLINAGKTSLGSGVGQRGDSVVGNDEDEPNPSATPYDGVGGAPPTGSDAGAPVAGPMCGPDDDSEAE